MADIKKNQDSNIIQQDKNLQKMYYITQIHEMMNQLKALDVQIDRIQNVELRQIELKKAELKKKIELKNRELEDLNVIKIKTKED